MNARFCHEVRILSVLFLVTCQSYGAIVYWQGSDGGLWDVAANWTDNHVPSDNGVDQVINTSNHCLIDSGVDAIGPYVEVGHSGTAGYLDITGGTLAAYKSYIGFGGTGTVTMSGGTVTIELETYIGRVDTVGTLTMTGGYWTTNQAYIALDEDDIGTLTLNGGIFEVESQHFYLRYYGGTGNVVINGTAELLINAEAESLKVDDINGYVDSGWITTTDTGHLVDVDVNSSTGVIKVTAIPNKKYWAGLDDGLWSNSAYWSPYGVPKDNGVDLILNTSNHCLIDSSVIAVSPYVEIGGNGGSGGNSGYLDITGGTFDVGNSIYIGFGGTGLVTMSGGTVEVDETTYVGRVDTEGTLTMTGGYWATNQAYIAYDTSDIGTLILNGGTFEVESPHFYVRYYGGTGNVVINGDAKLIIHDAPTGEKIDYIFTCIDNGWITTSDVNHVISAVADQNNVISITSKPTVIYVDDFGAAGNGTNNDTDALYAASQYLDGTRGGTLHLGISKIYLVGEQHHENGVFPYYLTKPIIKIDGGIRKVSILGHNSTMKMSNSLRIGSFDPNTGAVYNPTSFPFNNSKYRADPGDMIDIQYCSDVVIKDINLYGNNLNMILGGEYGDAGRQCQANGIYLMGNDTVDVNNVRSSYMGLDGICAGYCLTEESNSTPIHISNMQCYYNARQGLSWVGGIDLTVVDSNFSYTGKGAFYSPPGAGIDIEAQDSVCRNGQFINCEMVGNTGAGIIADSGDSADCDINDCLIWGTTSWSVWPNKPGFRFTNCDIYGTVVHTYGDADANKAVQFINCNFEDIVGSYTSTALLNCSGQNVKFDGCTIKANNTRSFYMDYNDTMEIIIDCSVYHNYADLATQGYQAYLSGSSLTNTRFYESLGSSNSYKIAVDTVTVVSGVVVDGPRCKWDTFDGQTGAITPGEY
jgi:hypothetical protein